MNVMHIPLTRGQVAVVDEDDWLWLRQYRWYCHKGKSKYPIAARRDRKTRRLILMHREIMRAPEGLCVDHVNGNTLDNRKANLRLCTHSENCRNAKVSTRSKKSSRFKGVSWIRRLHKWRASIMVGGKLRCLGHFNDEIEAARCYDEAARKYFGPFARVNEDFFPTLYESKMEVAR